MEHITGHENDGLKPERDMNKSEHNMRKYCMYE